VAVKKTAKKTAKKAVKKTAKSAAVKSATKVSAKRTVKKSAVKKSAVKKSAVKKSAVKKSAVKKSAVKKSVKRSAKKTSRSSTSTFVVPAVPVSASRPGVRSVNTSPTTEKTVSTYVSEVSVNENKKSSNRVVLAVLAGIVILALVVVSRNSSATKGAQSAATPVASAATSESSPSASTEASTPAVPSAGHLAPVGIVAHYTASGATIFWATPSDSTGITNYNIEIQCNGGTWKLISTVPATQLSMDVTKSATNGWCSFRVSTVYSDGTVTGGKVFGLPGQYA
jgi:hypothetical protein